MKGISNGYGRKNIGSRTTQVPAEEIKRPRTLADLPDEEKEKVSRLVERLVSLGLERDEIQTRLQEERELHEQQIEKARSLHDDISSRDEQLSHQAEALAVLQTQRNMAMGLLRLYQMRLKKVADTLPARDAMEEQQQARARLLEETVCKLEDEIASQKSTASDLNTLWARERSEKASAIAQLETRVKQLEGELGSALACCTDFEDKCKRLEEACAALTKQITSLHKAAAARHTELLHGNGSGTSSAEGKLFEAEQGRVTDNESNHPDASVRKSLTAAEICMPSQSHLQSIAVDGKVSGAVLHFAQRTISSPSSTPNRVISNLSRSRISQKTQSEMLPRRHIGSLYASQRSTATHDAAIANSVHRARIDKDSYSLSRTISDNGVCGPALASRAHSNVDNEVDGVGRKDKIRQQKSRSKRKKEAFAEPVHFTPMHNVNQSRRIVRESHSHQRGIQLHETAVSASLVATAGNISGPRSVGTSKRLTKTHDFNAETNIEETPSTTVRVPHVSSEPVSAASRQQGVGASKNWIYDQSLLDLISDMDDR